MKPAAITLAAGLVLVLLIVVLLGWFGEGQAELRAEKTAIALEQARELAPLWLAVKRVLVASLGAGGLAVALVAVAAGLISLWSVPNAVRWTWLRSWLVRPTQNALYPALAEPDGRGHIRVLSPVNEATAQRTAALVNGNVDRFGGAAVRQILRQDDPQAMLPEPAGTQSLALDEALAYNPKESPHWFMVGDTGSGKSTAVYSVADMIRQSVPAEFLVLERDGQDWNEQAAAITVPGYLEALEKVEAERVERAKLLRAADVDHISRLDQPPPYLVVVIEEAESVYSAMRLLGQAEAKRYTAIVRDLAAMGRKQGVILIVATQTGTSEVFDVPTRKNLGHKFFFRNEPGVADSWGIDRKQVNLAQLQPGTAWSLNHSALVNFPRARRPRLPASRLYRERRPEESASSAGYLLAADATADGVGANDLPSSPGTVELEPQNGRVYAAAAPWIPGTVPVPTGAESAPAEPAMRIESRRRPTPVEAHAMRAHYRRTGSKTAVCMAFYGYKNDEVWAWVEQALKGAI